MSNTIIEKEVVSKDFWDDAFDKGAPFYESYVKYFSKGVLEENKNILDVHREAIFYVKDHALLSVVVRLIFLAEKFPGAGFVESLAFFLSRKEQKERLKGSFRNVNRDDMEQITQTLDNIKAQLNQMGDDDLAEQFSQFQKIILNCVN